MSATSLPSVPEPSAEAFEVFQSPQPAAPVQHCGTLSAAHATAARRRARQQYPAPYPEAELWLIPAPAISQVRIDDGLESSYALDAVGPEPSEIEQEAEAYRRGEQDYAVFWQPAPIAAHTHRGMVRATSAAEALAQARLVFDSAGAHGSFWLVPWTAVLVVGPEVA